MIENVFEELKNKRELFLVSVTASWCTPCYDLRRAFWSDDLPVRVLEVDRDLFPDFAEEIEEVAATLGIYGLPTNVLFYGDTPVYAFTSIDRESFAKAVSVAKSLLSNSEEKVVRDGESVLRAVDKRKEGKSGSVGLELLKDAVDRILDAFDYTYGGFGFDVKHLFPMTHLALLILRRYREAEIVAFEIADGSIRDHVFGGFYRFCYERSWDYPNGVKTVVENAEMLIFLSLACRKLGLKKLRETARETANFLLSTRRELFGNSVLVENLSFVNLDELEKRFVELYYGVNDRNTFPRIAVSEDTVKEELGISESELEELKSSVKSKAIAKTKKDMREITSFNFHALTSLLYYNAVFREDVEVERVLKRLIRKRFGDVLYRYAEIEAKPEDYSYAIFCLVTNYYVNGWGLELAEELFSISSDSWKIFDSRTSSPLALKVLSSLHLYHITKEEKYLEFARETLKKFAGYEHNVYSGTYVVALKSYLKPIFCPRLPELISPDVFFWDKDYVEYSGRKFDPEVAREVVDG